MYKKLLYPTIIFLSTMTAFVLIINSSLPLVVCGFLASTSVFDLIDSCVSNVIILDIVESESIDTEIVARRIGSGLATAGLGGVGTGIGLVFSGLIKGFSRNPSLKDDLFSYAIFGFALTEAIGLFALMMAFMLLYA